LTCLERLEAFHQPTEEVVGPAMTLRRPLSGRLACPVVDAIAPEAPKALVRSSTLLEQFKPDFSIYEDDYLGYSI